MSAPSPPSFDHFFSDQQQNQQYDRQLSRDRQSSSNSTANYPYTQIQTPFSNPYAQHLSDDAPLTDEPPSLSRHGSNASLAEYGRGRAESLADRIRGVNMNDISGGATKQDSLPFDPVSSSTLIATAPRSSHRVSPGPQGDTNGAPIGETMFAPHAQYDYNSKGNGQRFDHQQWSYGGDNSFQQYSSTSQMGDTSPFPTYEGQSAGIGFQGSGRTSSGNDSFLYDSTTASSNQQNHGSWSHDFLGESNNMVDYSGGQGGGMQETGWSGGNGMEGMENLLSTEDEEQLNELARM